MAIYEIKDSKIVEVEETSFSDEGIKERKDLQRLIRDQVDIVSPDTLIISEEFGDWEDSKRRIDLLGVDKDANLVVIELKRTEDGGHMELQSLRYAAMISTMTFEKVVEAYKLYCEKRGLEKDARAEILSFLDWDGPDYESFAQEVRIVLVSGEFSKELTTTVLWLNKHTLDVRCIRLKPYKLAERVLVDAQQIIPLPEAADYLVKVREKEQSEKSVPKQQWDEASFLEDLRKNTNDELVAVVRDLLAWVEPLVTEIWWGQGKTKASFVAIFEYGGRSHYLFTVRSHGKLGIWFYRLKKKAPFKEEATLNEFLGRLRQVPGLDSVFDSMKSEYWFQLETLKDPRAFEEFKAAIEWAISRIQKFGEDSDAIDSE
jgi:hypothetical protein